MSDRVLSGNRRRASGRVTPSKLKRTTVVALDGVLALGAGALGGLFATGTATAAAPTPGWTGTQAPLPSGPDAPGTNPESDISSDSCVSAAFCAAVGDYQTSAHNSLPLLDTYAGGTWSSIEGPLPSDAGTDPDASLFGVSCPRVGFCVAVGEYENTTTFLDHGLIETLSGGVWSDMETPLPSGAGTGSDAGAWLSAVSCQTDTDCVAGGLFKNGSGRDVGLIDTLTGDTWSAQAAPQPADAAANQDVWVKDVSCPSSGACAAGGYYENGDDRVQALLFSQAPDGAWTDQATSLPSGAATGTAESSEADAVSCATTSCEAVGQYEDTSGRGHGLLESLADGVWTAQAAPEPGNAGSGADQGADLYGVSCAFDGCVAVGEYEDLAGGIRALVDTVTAGAVTAAEGPQPSGAAAGSAVHGALNGVSCLSVADCTAAGFYVTTASSNDVALIDSNLGGAWSNAVAPLPSTAATGSTAESGFQAVDCTSRGTCIAGGDFADTSSNIFPLVESYTPVEGYYSVASDGGIFNYGSANFHGSRGGQAINAPMVGIAATPGNGGYWEVGSDGGIFSYGNAVFHGSTGSLKLNAPIVGMAATPDGGGYWLVATDGGIFNYGDAGFYGSTGSIHLNKPIVGMASTPDGHGYWLVASDGGIFNYGDAGFYGSRGGQPLNKPIVGMAADATGLGYWLVASDGGIFNYGDSSFLGSRGGQPLNKPIVAMMSTFDGAGYWLTASDGGIFGYGDTGFYGSAGSIHLNAPVVSGTPS